MRAVLVCVVVSAAAFAACTTPERSVPSVPSVPESTSPPSPAFETFELELDEERINMEPGIASPGDLVVCGEHRIRVPGLGRHRGTSGEVWAFIP